MASSVAGHRRAFDTDTVPGIYEDLELADLVVITGSNMAWCHPVLYQRLAAVKEIQPDLKVVLIDPRRTMTAEIADLHLAIRPDGNVALFNGLFGYLNGQGGYQNGQSGAGPDFRAIDRAYVDRHTTGFSEALEAAGAFDLAAVAEQVGLDRDQVIEF